MATQVLRYTAKLMLCFALSVSAAPLHATAQPLALPEVLSPPVGDPRLEPIPDGAIHLVNFDVFANGKVVSMRFPPRVNGQAHSDGDKHADLFVLFNSVTGERIVQPSILEAVPKNSAGPGVPIGDFTARMFSAAWEMHAVTVEPVYDPGDPTMLIDSTEKLFSSALVRQIFQTNMFLNCPVVPLGSTVDPGSPPIEEAFFQGHIVNIAPYEIEDGGFNPQVMFMFKDQEGTVLGAPHLVASFAPGDPFYSSIWELWTVHVPNDFDVTALTSAADVKATGFPITSANIRLNCPAVAVDGVPIPFEDAFTLLENDNGTFNPDMPFQIDIPGGQFAKPRTFLITEAAPAEADLLDLLVLGDGPGNLLTHPLITPDDKGNVIPLILADPFQNLSSGPNSAGPIVPIDQAELDAAFTNNDPPELPAAIEANFAALISAGLLSPDWAPGVKPYVQRLALVGRALHELVWLPEQGANQKDVTACIACHSQPTAGGAARGLYTLERATERPDFGPPDLTVRLNPGSMWGSGATELLVQQKKAKGDDVTFAHGSMGQIPSIRAVVSGARNGHFGIQSTEVFGTDTDPDGDGVINESSAGEITAESAFLLTLPVPDQATTNEMLRILHVTRASLQRGRRTFRKSIDDAGAGCASCHTVFHPLDSTQFALSNPETALAVEFDVPHHFADQDDVGDGLASFIGQIGLRTYGDFKRHKMGALMFSAGEFGSDFMKTAELWDAGSVFPYLRDGSMGSDLRGVILAHAGVPLDDISVSRGPRVDVPNGPSMLSKQTVTITNNSAQPIKASADQPIRAILIGSLPTGLAAANADGNNPGGTRQGAFWLITETIPAGGSAVKELVFFNPNASALAYDLVIQDHVGYSEGAASTRAFMALDPAAQEDVINFLRAQLIDGKLGEGSGGEVPVVCGDDPAAIPVICDDGIACTFDGCFDGTCVSIDSCPAGQICNAASGGCETLVCIAAGGEPTGVFSGAMATSNDFTGGADADPLLDSLTTSLLFADSTVNAFGGGSSDEIAYQVILPMDGDWYAWGRFYYPGTPGSNDANSFLLRVDNGKPKKFGNNRDFFQRWHWDGNGNLETGAPQGLMLGTLTAGPHAIVIEKREVLPDGSQPRLDLVCFSKKPDESPSDLIATAIMGVMPCASQADCDDGNPCTDDICGEGGACANSDNSAPCDDGLFCNGADICSNGACATHSGDSCAPGGECASPCNEFTDTCNLPAGVTCSDDGNACTDDWCDGSGSCVHVASSAPCDDGIACTSDDTCSDGVCSGVHACGPGEVCDAATGVCEAFACSADTDCDDGDACNGAEQCVASVCSAGQPPICDDADACTNDTCDPTLGCLNSAMNCDDGSACTVDSCDAVQGCSNQPVTCNDANACTNDTCDPALGCINSAVSCDDGNACTVDSCNTGQGCRNEPVVCDDGNACTRDICQLGSCTAVDTCPAGSMCASDGTCHSEMICIAAGADDQAVFSGQMTTGTQFTGGSDADPSENNLTIPLLFANSPSNSNGGSGDEVAYQVVLPGSGNWFLWGRFYYPGTPGSNDANSFLISIDGDAAKRFGNLDSYQDWHWDGDGKIQHGAPAALDLGPLAGGPHTLVVEKREVLPNGSEPRLDVLCFTPSAAVAPTDEAALLALVAANACEVDADCENQDACTIDTCQAGACAHAPLDCSDADACTQDICDSATGACSHAPLSCDDGNLCTLDSCNVVAGCANAELVCPGDTMCNPASGMCAADVVCLAAGSDPSAAFSGLMTTGTQFGGGADADPVLDNLTTPLVFADSTANAFGGGSGDEVAYQVTLPMEDRWFLWGRFYYPGMPGGNNANSFLVRVDGNDAKKFGNNIDLFRMWHWDGNGKQETGAGEGLDLGMLPAGPHTIVLEKREVGDGIQPRVDVLCLSTQGTVPPSDVEALALVNDDTTGCTLDIDCDDADPCTDDICDLASGLCAHGPTVCSDGNACTDNICDPVSGCVTTPIICADVDPCTIDSCDPGTGCSNLAIDCSDGDDCTIDECELGECFHEIVAPCNPCANSADCDDGDLCTDDVCDEDGFCEITIRRCNDFDLCTTDSCNPLSGDCVHDPLDCSDGDLCTDDTCDSFAGCSNDPVACADGGACTVDGCQDPMAAP